MQKPINLLIPTLIQSNDPKTFIEKWASLYDYPHYDIYSDNIKRPIDAKKVEKLFKWKNGREFSRSKKDTVEKNILNRVEELKNLPENTSAEKFLDKFSEGGPIWRIFFLHIWKPDKFPIFDQHVWRAMKILQGCHSDWELPPSSKKKVECYMNIYLDFWEGFTKEAGSDIDPEKLDQALWTFGKFFKTWPSLIISKKD